MASKLCDSCKSAAATLFCRVNTAFLCVNCDTKIHNANNLASRQTRVQVCEVCKQEPMHVKCKADAAALCVTCDRDIHSANPQLVSTRVYRLLPSSTLSSNITASSTSSTTNVSSITWREAMRAGRRLKEPCGCCQTRRWWRIWICIWI